MAASSHFELRASNFAIIAVVKIGLGADPNQLLILITNDDGVDAPGLKALRSVLVPLGRVVVAAPAEERSASSQALTIHHPIRVKMTGEDSFAITGTPADCVILALRKLLPRPPDVVVSGINHGPNLGEDVLYSGTVGAAREAALSGCPALAISLVSRREEDYAPAARFTARLIRELFPGKMPPGTCLNVNVPGGAALDYRFTRQGSKEAPSAIEEKEDPRGRSYYWIGQDAGVWKEGTDTDYQAVREGFVSVTPLQRDQTDYKALGLLSREEPLEIAENAEH